MFTFPTMSALIASTTTDIATLTTNFLPLLYLAFAVTVAVVAIKYVIKKVNGGVSRAAGMGRRARGRRR